MPMQASDSFWPHQQCWSFNRVQRTIWCHISQTTGTPWGTTKCCQETAWRYNKIKAAILNHGNPFDAEGDQLYNFMTHEYVPQKVCHPFCISMKLVRNYMKIMLPNESMEMSVCWHRSRSRTTPCSCQETRCKQPRSVTIGGSERNERSLWWSDGPSQIKSGCGSEECQWELWVYCDSQGTVCHRWIHPSMYWQVEAHTLPGKAGETQWIRSKWTSAIIWDSCWKRWWIRNITSSLWESKNCYCDWNDDRPTDGKEVRNNQHSQRFQPALQQQATNVDSRFWWGYSGLWHLQSWFIEAKNNGI